MEINLLHTAPLSSITTYPAFEHNILNELNSFPECHLKRERITTGRLHQGKYAGKLLLDFTIILINFNFIFLKQSSFIAGGLSIGLNLNHQMLCIWQYSCHFILSQKSV